MELSTINYIEFISENMEVLRIPAAAIKDLDFTLKPIERIVLDDGSTLEHQIANHVHIEVDAEEVFKAFDEEESQIFDISFGNKRPSVELIADFLMRTDLTLIDIIHSDNEKLSFYPEWFDIEMFEEYNQYQENRRIGNVVTIDIEASDSEN